MRWWPLLRRLRRNQDGATLVEFAIVAPVMGAMLLGVVDVSLYISSSLAVQRAARAGGEYAIASGYDATKISTAVTDSTSTRSAYMTAITADPAPSKWCGCPDSGTSVVAATCGSKCTSGLKAGTYVSSSAKSTYQPLFNVPGLGTSRTIVSTATVRIE